MSKWHLLRSSLLEGKRETNGSQTIHRYKGIDLFPKTKIKIWNGYIYKKETKWIDFESYYDFYSSFSRELHGLKKKT